MALAPPAEPETHTTATTLQEMHTNTDMATTPETRNVRARAATEHTQQAGATMTRTIIMSPTPADPDIMMNDVRITLSTLPVE